MACLFTPLLISPSNLPNPSHTHTPQQPQRQQPAKHRRRAGAAKPSPSTTTPAAPSPGPSHEVVALFESALAEFPHPAGPLEAQRATADARRSGSRAPTVSALQQEVSLGLEALGLALRSEVDDGGVFQYDFVVDHPAAAASGAGTGGRRRRSKAGVAAEEAGGEVPEEQRRLLPVVVEVDGSPHFFVNDLKQPLGDTQFKRRLVRAQVRR